MNQRENFSLPVSTLAGSTVPNIISRLKSHKIQKKYYPKLIISVGISSLLQIFSFWEKKRWDRQIKEYRMKSSPVFIIGFWRSGTTLMHNLLCQDEKAGYTTTLQTVFPHIILSQKKWLKKFLKFIVPKERPFDHMKLDLDFPQEEEYGMTNVNSQSLYDLFLFPGDFDTIVKNTLQFEEKDIEAIEKWKKEYRYFISKSMLNTGGTRYVGKNPCNLYRIKTIKEIYPDARFIFIHRSPYQVIESLYRFILSVFPGVQLQDIPEDYSREKIVLLYRDILESYLKIRNSLHPCDLIEIRMDDFLSDKLGTLKKIYNRFYLPGFANALPAFCKYLDENPSVENHFYQVHPETIRLVNLHASAIVKRLGYQLQKEHIEEQKPEPVPEHA